MKNYYLSLILFFNAFNSYLIAQKTNFNQEQPLQISGKTKDNTTSDTDNEKLIQDSTAVDWERLLEVNNMIFDHNEIRFVRASEYITYEGSKNGIEMWDGFSHLHITEENSQLPENHITALAIDRKAQLWIGTFSSGIVIGTGDPVKPYKIKPVSTHEQNIFGISVDAYGLVWVTYRNGAVECFKDEVSNAYFSNQ